MGKPTFYYGRRFADLQVDVATVYILNNDPDVCVKTVYPSGVHPYGETGSTHAVVPTRLSRHKGKKVQAWKKCYYHDALNRYLPVLVELEIPAGAKRQQSFNYKCRASSARVIAIYAIDRGRAGKRLPKTTVVHSEHDWHFTYRVGKVVRPKGRTYDNAVLECASGIHFFLTKKEAVAYS